jgi:hypothetical protein
MVVDKTYKYGVFGVGRISKVHTLVADVRFLRGRAADREAWCVAT